MLHQVYQTVAELRKVALFSLAVVDAPVPPGIIGGFENDLMEEFMRAFAGSARLTLHLRLIESGNPHHVIEVCFKAVARALRMAVISSGLFIP